MIDSSEAAAALRSVDLVKNRTEAASTYSAASPHLLLSGVVWILGYVATGMTRPAQWPIFWIPLALICLAGSFAIALRSSRPDPVDPIARVRYAARGLWLSAAMIVFIESTYLLFRPTELTAYFVFPALLMGLIYAVVGAFGRPRFVWIGAGIFAVTIAGLLIAPAAILFWAAAAGGGGLVLGGLWLRRA
jgi:hypothetical protein